jgi:hypothetical protein
MDGESNNLFFKKQNFIYHIIVNFAPQIKKK